MTSRSSSRSSSVSYSSHDEPSSRPTTPLPEDVQAYQQLMTSLFPPSSLPPPPAQPTTTSLENDEETEILDNGVKRPMTKAEKQNAKKKRRKERERLAKMEAEAGAQAQAQRTAANETSTSNQPESLVKFRLFSACPVQDVSITPDLKDESYSCPVNSRHLPLSAETSQSIRSIANEAAIDPEDLNQSSSSSATRQVDKIYSIDHTQVTALPPLFIGVTHRKSHKSTHDAQAQLQSRTSIPTIPLRVPQTHPKSPEQIRKKTRRGKRQKIHSQARFWAPPPGLGGKARGYAWGYRDSMEGRREVGAWGGYVRSKDR